MDAGSNEEGPTRATPDEAFAMIGHETRVEILKVLASTDRADRPVRFSRIRARLGGIDSAHFNYHLDKLTGHFLEQTEEGYDFRRPGRRVTQAILSGAVTGNPMSELTAVDQRCHHCGSPVEVVYRQGRIAIYCTGCDGTYESSSHQERSDDIPDGYGFLGLHDLPPAGMADRSPTEALEAAHRWSLSDTRSTVNDLCPRCGSTVEAWIDVCEPHDNAERCCDRCGYRHAVVYTASCTTCTFDKRLPYGTVLLGNTALQSFLTSRGIDPTSADYETFSSVFKNYGEEVVSTDPFEAVFTYAVDGDEIALAVGDDLDVRSVSR